MECIVVEEALIGFQLGSISDGERAGIEGHLVGCKACLESFFAVKRAHERGLPGEPAPARPSLKAREKLRAEFEKRALAAAARRKALAWGGLAAAAAAAAVALTLLFRAPAPPVASQTPEVDTARPVTAALEVY